MLSPEVHPVVNSRVLLPPAGQHVPHLLGGHAQVEAGGAVAHGGGGAVAQRGVRRAWTASDRAAATAKNLEKEFCAVGSVLPPQDLGMFNILEIRATVARFLVTIFDELFFMTSIACISDDVV